MMKNNNQKKKFIYWSLIIMGLVLIISGIVLLVFIPKETVGKGCFVGSWRRGDEVISFGKDGSYIYYCSCCGEPVGASDLYEWYKYNKKEKRITLYTHDERYEDEYIKVVFCNDNKLVLDFDGKEKTFER